MPSPPRSPKTLSEWFELDYFRRRRLFRGLWRSSSGLALLVSCLAVGWTFLAGKHTVYQAGPLSTAHALFNNDCGKCHTEAFPVLNRLWTTDAAVRSVPDSACLQCHAGPLHHTCVAQQSCAGCHHEHRGQKALARVTDNQCTACHADLKCDNGKTPDFTARVVSFAAGGHPEFRFWRDGEPTDPGTLQFNHKVHLESLPSIDRKNRVQLDCHSCHEMDAAGRFMRPINYDRHCKECHPLSVQLVGNWPAPQSEAARAFSSRPAPHPAAGETAETVRGVVRERLTRFIQDNKAFLKDAEPAEPPRPLPGWMHAEPVSPREYAWVNHQLTRIERVLFDGGGGCRHCHREKTTPARRPGGLPDYLAPGLLGVEKPWYEHSVFSHRSHQALDCAQCHADVKTSAKASDVLMPRIETCQRCHNASDRASARSDCVECHIYHAPKQQRQFQGRLSIDEFRGK
jgi:hypothetical protein